MDLAGHKLDAGP
jgi:hypothetical protein